MLRGGDDRSTVVRIVGEISVREWDNRKSGKTFLKCWATSSQGSRGIPGKRETESKIRA